MPEVSNRIAAIGLKWALFWSIIFCGISAYGGEWQWEAGSWREGRDLSDPSYERFTRAMELFREKTPTALARAQGSFAHLAKDEENPYWFESRLMLGACLLERGELEKSYKVLKGLLKDSPPPKVKEAALDAEVQIAEAYLSGVKKKVFGIRAFDSFSRAMRILREVLAADPNGRLARAVQIRMADSYYSRGNYLEAGLAYDVFLRRFSDDPAGSYCQLRLIQCRLKESRGANYDPVPYEESRDALKKSTKEQDPDLREEAERLLKEVRRTLAEKDFLIAEYYLKSKKPQAAAHYYRRVLAIYPDTIWAGKAEEQLATVTGESQGE